MTIQPCGVALSSTESGLSDTKVLGWTLKSRRPQSTQNGECVKESDRQLSLNLRTPARHGGRRQGAGRKPRPNPLVRHLSRPRLSSHHPCHITLRVHKGAPSLRAPAFVRDLERSLVRGCDRGEFRLVHYALLRNHAHLIVEAESRHALGRGMKSLSRRMTWAMRRAFGWRGGLLADRYHLRALKTPREVRNAIRYVLLNAARHRRGALHTLDPASSGRWFDGWKRGAARVERHPGPSSVASARTWLLGEGWRRLGLLDPLDVPGGARASP